MPQSIPLLPADFDANRSWNSDQLGLPNSRLELNTLRGGVSDGVQMATIDNGACRVQMLPTRGMGIWRASCQGEFGWHSPVRGPVHPRFVPLAEPSGLGWLDGFDELLCRCGLVSNGAPEFDERGHLLHALHGRIANLPAREVTLTVDAQRGEMHLTGIVEETRFLIHSLRLTSTLILRPGEPGFRLVDTVTNFSARPGEMELLYHINLGDCLDGSDAPLLEAGAKLLAPVKTLVPRNARAVEGLDSWQTYGPPQAGFAEQVYFTELHGDDQGNTQAVLHNAAGSRGMAVQFNLQQLPYFTLWKNTGALADGYVTGLEPCLNFPNVRSFEKRHGRVRQLAPGESATFELSVSFLRTATEVQVAAARVAALQSTAPPTIHREPQANWCG